MYGAVTAMFRTVVALRTLMPARPWCDYRDCRCQL